MEYMTYADADAKLRKIADHDEQLVEGQGDAVDRVLDEVLDLSTRVAELEDVRQATSGVHRGDQSRLR